MCYMHSTNTKHTFVWFCLTSPIWQMASDVNVLLLSVLTHSKCSYSPPQECGWHVCTHIHANECICM